MSVKNTRITGKQRKRIDAAVNKARPNGNGKIPVTAQQTIPFQQMYKDGICRTDANHYNKTIQFFDINYQLAQNEDKTAIFDSYCDFLNYFDCSINVQLSFLNQLSDLEEFGKMIELAPQDDDFNDIRNEYSEMLKNQLAKGNNGLVKTKFITFGIESKNLKEAKSKLERIEADIIGNFKTMGVLAQPLNGAERLAILHRCFNPDGREKFGFSWEMLPQTGLSVKDYIAPSSFDFSSLILKEIMIGLSITRNNFRCMLTLLKKKRGKPLVKCIYIILVPRMRCQQSHSRKIMNLSLRRFTSLMIL